MEQEGDAPAAPAAPAAPGKPRLVIKELELENFKSYAGVQKVGPFHKSFSSVVGPNGSGKSNVIDAMLFVFGKRAKQLRLNKVSELIHTSANHSDIDSARVSVYFHEIVDDAEEEEGFEAVAGSEMVVTRTAHSNNTSKYYLNGRLSNFTEVTATLREKGIDLDHNRFLILQGEVEQISMMKPKAATPHDEGLLEYLEDIIGTNRYIERIDELNKQLEEVTEQRDSHVQRLKHVEKERDGLEGARKEAEAFMTKEGELLGWQSVLYRLYIKQAGVNLEQIHATKDQLEARLREEKERQAESDAALGAIKKEYEAGVRELDAVQSEMDETGREFKDFERRDVKFREDLKHLKAKAKKASDRAAKEEKKAAAAEEEAGALAAALPGLEESIAAAREQLAPADAHLAELEGGIQSEVNGYRKELEAVQSELVPWERKIAEAKARLDGLEFERKTLNDKHAGAREALESAVGSMEGAEGAHRSKAAELAGMEEELGAARAELGRLREEERGLREEGDRLTQSARAVGARCRERKAASDAVKSRGQVLSSLMAAKSSGRIAGIWGRLGDLGAVDARYDVAASTSSGALDYIVVDDTATAQKCVLLLREKGLGVATFLILDKQRHLLRQCQEPASPPEGARRLYDLLDIPHEELRPAFFYAFRNTVVAEDLDQASRIAYGADKRWRRVVTLDGQLIESSGTISGGGGRPRGGRIRTGSAGGVTSPREEEELGAGGDDEEALRKIEARLKAAQKELKEAQKAIRATEQRVSKMELSLKKLAAEVDACGENARSLGAQLESLREAAEVPAEDAARLEELAREIGGASRELEKHSGGCASLHGRVEALKSSIEEAGGQPMKDARARAAELRGRIEALTKEIPQTRVKISSQEKAAKKSAKASGDARAEAERLAGEMEELKESFKGIEGQAMVVMEKFKEAQELQAEKAEALRALTARYDEKKEEVATIRTTGVDIEAKLDDCARSLVEEAANRKHWEGELKKCAAALAERAPGEEEGHAISDEELSTYTIDDAKYNVTMAEAELEKMKPDMNAIEEYKKKDSEYAERLAGLEEISRTREGSRAAYEALRRRRLDEFMAGFNVISMKLKEMYQMITLGGDAELELVDSLDPFSEGIVFSVRPPKKSWKNICNLSGGEKTLSSLALVFALHHFKPTPLYVMDEIDAALDFKNVSIVAHYIKERTRDAQFVIISLRNNMFELADRLVGIYKTDNCTKSVTINPSNFSVSASDAGAAPIAA